MNPTITTAAAAVATSKWVGHETGERVGGGLIKSPKKIMQRSYCLYNTNKSKYMIILKSEKLLIFF
jgi:hypothetical protein